MRVHLWHIELYSGLISEKDDDVLQRELAVFTYDAFCFKPSDLETGTVETSLLM
jgi:hypothetical protein